VRVSERRRRWAKEDIVPCVANSLLDRLDGRNTGDRREEDGLMLGWRERDAVRVECGAEET
jgi:hypothetical protein